MPAMTRADLDKAPQDVASMFDTVAERYDLTNDVLSAGQDRAWRKAPVCPLYTSPSPRDRTTPRMPSSASKKKNNRQP